MNIETLYFLRDMLNDITLSVSTPDFRHRARLVCDALDELDAAIESGGVNPAPITPADFTYNEPNLTPYGSTNP